nr:ABC transporter ATP-binding protein [Kineosporia babensis]
MLSAVLQDDLGSAGRWLGVLAAATLAASVVYYVQGMRGFTMALTVLDTLHGRIGAHVVRMPLGWFAGESVGRLSRITTSGVQAIVSSIAHLMQPLVRGVLAPVTIAVVVCFYDWRLGLVAIIASPFIYWCFRFSARLLGASDELADEAAVTSGNRVLEFARHQPVLRAFGQSTSGYAPLEAAIENQRQVGRKQLNWTLGGMLLSGTTIQLTFTVMVLIVVLLAGGPQTQSLQLVALLALLARFIGPLALVSELSGGVRMARNDLDRVQAVLDVKPLPEPAAPAVFDSAQTGAIAFENVRFGYPQATPVLKGVDFSVQPGSVTALVGRSGSGKTTITRIAARFHEVDGGTVRIGGVDVREQTTAQLMGQLSLVFQDVYLFDGTIAENVRLGRESATDEELAEAAQLSGVNEIVNRLPAGWDTRVGEGGAALSGGERQRVSIARALLKRAPIVLLDEATAALDATNEALVRRSLQALSRHGTVLVIAHTPAMITSADRILVLEQGTIAASGSHDELLVAHQGYASMFAERAATAGWQLRA